MTKVIIIDTIEDFQYFIDLHSHEILSSVKGCSDGWNQKVTAINKILSECNIEVSDNVYCAEEYDTIINNI